MIYEAMEHEVNEGNEGNDGELVMRVHGACSRQSPDQSAKSLGGCKYLQFSTLTQISFWGKARNNIGILVEAFQKLFPTGDKKTL